MDDETAGTLTLVFFVLAGGMIWPATLIGFLAYGLFKLRGY